MRAVPVLLVCAAILAAGTPAQAKRFRLGFSGTPNMMPATPAVVPARGGSGAGWTVRPALGISSAAASPARSSAEGSIAPPPLPIPAATPVAAEDAPKAPPEPWCATGRVIGRGAGFCEIN